MTAAPPAFCGTVHLVFSSHWDREWYLPFQKFRGKLVAVLDRVLAELESGRLAFYQMDGQFIPVEDYLEIRPEKEGLIRELVRQGRFMVGPWYNLPDEFLVSGESLVRNLLLGMKRAEAFGQTSKVGWLCDIFGHNSQMPQVLAQLGIDNAVLWRGVDASQAANPFQWEGADGTRLLAHRFPQNGYADFGFDVRKVHLPDVHPTPEEMAAEARAYLEKTRADSAARDLLWFDGGDHLEFDPALLEVAAKLNREAGRAMVQVSTLDQFLEALRRETPASVLKGELREPAKMETLGWLIPGVSSSRVPLKQLNHAGETLLVSWAEPWCAAAHFLLGAEYPDTALELAWEYLLKNHPHDSICGCSPDETHAAMPYRFAQSRHIAEYYLDHAFTALSRASFEGRLEDGEIGLSAFTPASGAAQSCPEVVLQLPRSWPQFAEFLGFESKPSLRLFDLEGREVGYQLLHVRPSTTRLRVPPCHFPAGEERQGVRLALDLCLPAGSVRHLVAKRAEGPTRNPAPDGIGAGRATLRNEHLEAAVANDGTLTLTDLASGRTFRGLLALEDGADIGDGWYHGVALQDAAYLSTGGQATFGLTENGPLLARLRIRVEWPVPEAFDFTQNTRSPRLATLAVEHLVTLRKGASHLEIDTTVHNSVRDHRLRILCPTGLEGVDSFWADTPFDAVQRPVRLREDSYQRREIQVEMTPQQNWVAATDGRHGLALIAPGQYESAVLHQPDRPLCLTLLRAFRRAVFTDGNEGGQVQGTHRFRLALQPFTGAVPAARLFHIAQALAAPARAVQLEINDLRPNPARPSQPALPYDRLPRLDGDVVLSASHRSGPGQWTFRAFNPSNAPATVRLTGGAAWHVVDMRGRHPQPVPGTACVLKPRQILTLRATV